MTPSTPRTQLSHHEKDAIVYRDRDLVTDVIGQRTFVEVFVYQALGRDPEPGESRVIDAVLISLMEHGFTPSVIAARQVYFSSPENLQAGVAAGLLAVGSRFVGTMEDCALLLDQVVENPSCALAIARDHKERRAAVPGFGHHLHRPEDPRVAPLLALGAESGVNGSYVEALHTLATAVDEVAGRHIAINNTGAVAALLGDIGVPSRLMRGFAIVGRAAGLVSHLAEEQTSTTGRFIWNLVDDAIPFDHDGSDGGA